MRAPAPRRTNRTPPTTKGRKVRAVQAVPTRGASSTRGASPPEQPGPHPWACRSPRYLPRYRLRSRNLHRLAHHHRRQGDGGPGLVRPGTRRSFAPPPERRSRGSRGLARLHLPHHRPCPSRAPRTPAHRHPRLAGEDLVRVRLVTRRTVEPPPETRTPDSRGRARTGRCWTSLPLSRVLMVDWVSKPKTVLSL
jgi:hypothetical protein